MVLNSSICESNISLGAYLSPAEPSHPDAKRSLFKIRRAIAQIQHHHANFRPPTNAVAIQSEMGCKLQGVIGVLHLFW